MTGEGPSIQWNEMMRAQTRLLLAAVLALFMAGSGLAVTQTDVVGYWTHDLKPGFNLVAFPVLPLTPTLQRVIGEQLGEVEVTTYDPQISGYRWARFDPATDRWSGTLFLLGRGTAYWIYIPGNEAKSLTVTGHPELYTKFRWHSLNFGWKYYAPTYGKAEGLRDLPPAEPRDLLISWDPNSDRFGIAEATSNLQWRSVDIAEFAPDRAYIALLHRQPPRQVGPPLEIELQYDRRYGPGIGGIPIEGDAGNFHRPPEPLVVGNQEGLAVCNSNGEPCNTELRVFVVRELTRVDGEGELETFYEQIGSHRTIPDMTRPGRFNLALTVGEGFLRPGDRIALVVRDGRGGETRSTTFEVPAIERVIGDVVFNDPLRAPEVPVAPTEFALGTPFPNPFNDRFSLEIRLPEASPVSLTLYDIAGRRAFEYALPLSAGAHRLSVPAGSIPAGIYLMQVTAGAHKGIAKLAHLK